MRTNILTIFLALCLFPFVSASANHPDSVYVRPDVPNGTRDFQIAWSIDKVHWKHVACNLFESDYGPWGSEKKLYYPVLKYDGKKYHATFIPNPKIAQIAETESDNFTLWKPQDYPYIPQAEMEALLKKQQQESERNIIRIPYTDLQQLLYKESVSELNRRNESENFVETATPILNTAKDIRMTLKVNGNDCKAISPDLLGIFFEDISYAADGGLYAELIQNRDFEYSAIDHGGWDSMTAWEVSGNGITSNIETSEPISNNNPHYITLSTGSAAGGTLSNTGWDGIALKAKAKYNLSMFLRGAGKIKVSLVDGNKVLAWCTMSASQAWKQQKAVLTPTADAVTAKLVIEPLTVGDLSLDFISLIPQDTYKGHGLRKDLAEVIADLKPRFVRFPGGCASHGQGIDNIYHWQATVGELWDRQPDMNIWHYHQSRGLGFYEYFQFCEDIGAEALPVLAAGVPCQNSARGGNGQQGGIPFEKDLNGKPSPYSYMGKPLTMESYLQELLDLIEWANGDAKTSSLAGMRAKAGHPKPFNMKYLGIGNEDLISDVFLERYLYLIDNLKKAHPEITIIGTVGPFWQGSDYEYGWRAAKENNIEIVDEHYYNTPGWFFHHRDFYDNYDRSSTKVYLGEWASKGNNAGNALVEAAYLTNLERNADVVVMSSYAPLLANSRHTNWRPDLIYFGNTWVNPSANYYVQRAFGHNSGDKYVESELTVDYTPAEGDRKPLTGDISNRIDKSVVIDSNTGDVIVKVASLLPVPVTANIDIQEIVGTIPETVTVTTLAQPSSPDKSKEWATNETRTIDAANLSNLVLPAWSFTIIRGNGDGGNGDGPTFPPMR